MSEQKLRIGIDIDDVLIKSAELSIQLYNQEYGTNLTMEHWYDFDDPATYAQVWGSGDNSVLVKRVVSGLADDRFIDVEPIDGAKAVLRQLNKEGHELYAVTGRSESIRKQTKFILDKNYQGIFKDETLFFVDHFEHDGQRVSKADVGLELGLTHFIDDFPAHASALARVGIKTILFSPGYAWNRDGVDEDVKNAVVVLGEWRTIGEYLDAESAK
jgi:uncharacterized HAD superfamily protein